MTANFSKTRLGGMSENYILKLDTVSGEVGLLVALNHNHRQFEGDYCPENIDSSRSCLNYSLVDDLLPEQIVVRANELIAKVGIAKVRSNVAMAIEVVFSLPANRHQQDTSDFFADCYQWLMQTFPSAVLSFQVHLDELAPHAHGLVLPLVDGTMNASKLMGGKAQMYARNDDFHLKVAGNYGLSKSERLYGKARENGAARVFSALSTDPICDSRIYRLIADSIKTDPIPFMKALGLSYKEPKKAKSFTGYMTSKGKGHKKTDWLEIQELETQYPRTGMANY